jgi:hypothetical protein
MVNHSVRNEHSRFRSSTNRKNTGFSQWIQQSWRALDALLIQKSTRDFAASGRFDNAPLQQIMFALVAS